MCAYSSLVELYEAKTCPHGISGAHSRQSAFAWSNPGFRRVILSRSSGSHTEK